MEGSERALDHLSRNIHACKGVHTVQGFKALPADNWEVFEAHLYGHNEVPHLYQVGLDLGLPNHKQICGPLTIKETEARESDGDLQA